MQEAILNDRIIAAGVLEGLQKVFPAIGKGDYEIRSHAICAADGRPLDKAIAAGAGIGECLRAGINGSAAVLAAPDLLVRYRLPGKAFSGSAARFFLSGNGIFWQFPDESPRVRPAVMSLTQTSI